MAPVTQSTVQLTAEAAETADEVSHIRRGRTASSAHSAAIRQVLDAAGIGSGLRLYGSLPCDGIRRRHANTAMNKAASAINPH